jgi:transposase
VGASVPRWQLRAGEKGGSGVGKTKIGKGAKVMVVADGHGLPIGLHVASARSHAHTLAESTWATIKVPQRRGRPRTRPWGLIADRGYDNQVFRQQLRWRGIKPTNPMVERRRHWPKRGRPIRPCPSHRDRWKVERCFAWMANCRRLVVRYEHYVEHYRAFCLLAIILRCLNLILK